MARCAGRSSPSSTLRQSQPFFRCFSSYPRPRPQQPAPVVLDTMTAELHRAFTSLGKVPIAPSLASAGADNKGGIAADTSYPTPAADKLLPPYFLSYSVRDTNFVSIRAMYDALAESSAGRTRMADVQVRVGDLTYNTTVLIAVRPSTPSNSRSATTAKPSRVPFGWPPTPATAPLSTTTFASRLKLKSAPRKKILRPTSASRRRKSTSTPSRRPSSLIALRGSSG